MSWKQFCSFKDTCISIRPNKEKLGNYADLDLILVAEMTDGFNFWTIHMLILGLKGLIEPWGCT